MTFQDLIAPPEGRLRRPVDPVHVLELSKSYASGDTGAGRVITVNLDTDSTQAGKLTQNQINAIKSMSLNIAANPLSTQNTAGLMTLLSQGVKFETINGNHRRAAGPTLKATSPEIYSSIKFTATVYANLSAEMAFQLASKANLNSWQVRRNTFYEDVIATRKVNLFFFKFF
jgi:hypothetical protein